MQLRSVGAYSQHLALFAVVEWLGPGQQFTFARGAVGFAGDQAGLLHGFHRVGGNGGQRELRRQVQARPGHLQQLQQAIRAVFVKEEVVELDLLQLPHMLDHTSGFFGGQVQLVFPQVAVFQAAVFGQFFLVGHQREQPRVATHQAFPGVQDAVVAAFDIGTEVDGVAQQRGVVAAGVGLVDAQQGVPEHRRRAVQVGCREDQRGAVRVDRLVPGLEFLAVRLWQVL
ncbi:hypothetical protein D9M73_156790 [compost metagenome]